MVRRKIILITVLACCLIIFLAGNFFSAKIFAYYLQKSYQLSAGIERFFLSPSSLKIEGLDLTNDYLSFRAKKAAVHFSFKGFFKPEITAIKLNEAELTVPRLEALVDFLPSLLADESSPQQPSEGLSIDLSLNDVALVLNSAEGFRLEALFSVEGFFDKGRLSRIDTLAIPHLNLKTKDISLSARLLPQAQNNNLFVDSFSYKDKSLKNIVFAAVIDESKAVLTSESFALLGLGTFLKAELFYDDYSRPCLKAALENASFHEAGVFFGFDESVSISGPFGGAISLCLKRGAIDNLQGALTAAGDGTIRINKELALDFLKERLDKKSYDTLVDSFQNYTYNKGAVDISKKGDVVSLRFDFNSISGGRRDITINYHMPGGEK